MAQAPRSARALVGALLFCSGPTWAACPAAPAEVEANALSAIDAFTAGSKGAVAFDQARDAMREGAGCLSAPPTPRQAALVHAAEALAAFTTKDLQRTQSAFQAMIESDPTFGLSEETAPPEGLVDRQRQAALAMPPAERAAVALPQGYTLVVDGAISPTRPSSRPALLVIVESDGDVYWSGIVPVGGRIPDPPPSVALAEPPTERRPLPWFVAASGVAVAAGGMWAAEQRGARQISALRTDIAQNATEDEVGMSYDEASALYDRTAALRIAAPVTAGVALGLGAVGVVVWRW